jgi:hypothetical protein
MKRHRRILVELAKRARRPTFESFHFGPCGHVAMRDRYLHEGTVYFVGQNVLMPPDAFSQLAIKLGVWVPRELLDQRYRHPKKIQRT